MSLYFITGNEKKFTEAKAILPNICQLKIDLPEIQDIDAKKIIKEKIKEAFHHQTGEFIVEDTSLYFECLNGLPGPLIKWFIEKIGNDGLFNIVKKLGNNKAEARTIIAYAKRKNEVYYFQGLVKGIIVKPRIKSKFSWDPIFKPNNLTKTFAELSKQEKNKISMRRIAFDKLKKFIKTNK